MICPNCGTENRPFANYCHNCRHQLARHCPNCSALNPEGFNFCDHCGHPLRENSQRQPSAPAVHPPAQAPLDATPITPIGEPLPQLQRLIPQTFAEKLLAARDMRAMEGERRVVTMLFCDVQGSTFAASQLDPENWAEVMNGMFEHMIAPIYHYEGTVARLMGDAILAFFGAPITHEDDPLRAVLAGLDIVQRVAPYKAEIAERWGVDVDVRVGINTGLVLVGQVGSDLQMEYTALGEAINLAARMEQTAEPGTVQITEHTHKFLAQAFVFEDLGELEIKGVQEPVQAYRVLSREAATTFRRRGIEGLRAPLIGRAPEWRLLVDAAESALQGDGRIVFVVGEAGLGKSRLVEELSRALEGRATWFETGSLSFEVSQPYGLFQRLVRRVLETTPQDGPDVLRSKIGRAVRSFPEAEQAGIQKALESLFSLGGSDGSPPLEGEAFRSRLFAAFETYLRQIVAQQPVALICDDLHWTDPASVALLEHLFSLVTELPFLVICPTRPEPASPGWRLKALSGEKHPEWFTEIGLQPLSPSDSNLLVDKLLDINRLPDALRGRILNHAEGNPFFVEEMVRELIESGVIRREPDSAAWVSVRDDEEIEIPDNLQALLTARIDRLGDETRRVLQLAALIGRSFYYRVLKMIVDAGAQGGDQVELDSELARLQQADFIQVASEQPELEYIFRHVLTQEAAYQTILLRQRRRYHALVGDAMEILFPGQLDEHAARLSFHFLEAGDEEKSMQYASMAGDTALRLWASQEAVEHYSKALQIAESLLAQGNLEAVRRQLPEIYSQRGRSMELGSYFREALQNYQAMEAEGRRLEDRSLQLAAIVRQGTMRSIISEQFDPAEAIRLSKRGLKLAVELEDKGAEARIHWNLLQVYRFIERSSDALHHGIRSLQLSKELNLEEQIAFVSNDLTYTYAFNGLVDQAIAIAHEAADRWRALGNLPMLADCLATTAYLYAASGQLDEGIRYAEEAFELSASINNLWGQSHSTYQIGIAHWARGDIDRAIRTMQTAYQKGDESGFVVPQIWSRGTLALLYSNLGDLESARRITQEAQARTSAFLPSGYTPFVQSIVARVALLDGDLETAEATIQPYDYNPDASLGKLAAPFVEYTHTTILFARRDYEGVVEKTARMITFFRETGLGLYLPGGYFMRARALLKLDRLESARESLEAGITCARMMKARWWLWLLEKDMAQFAEDPLVRAELEASSESHFNFIVEHIQDQGLRASFLKLQGQAALQF